MFKNIELLQQFRQVSQIIFGFGRILENIKKSRKKGIIALGKIFDNVKHEY